MDSIDLTSLGAGLAAGAALATCLGLGGGKPGPSGFGELVEQQVAKVGAANVLSVADAKAFIEQEKPFIIDVKDSSDKDAIKNDKTYSVPLSNLVFAADPDLELPALPPAIKEPVPKGALCHEALKDKSAPILVSCGLGGQAVIAAGLLCDYGFTNVKVVDGGNNAWGAGGGATCPCAK